MIDFKFLRWSSLRNIGQSKAAGLTIFIPLLGWTILLNNNIIEYVTITSDLFHSSDPDNKNDSDASGIGRLFTLSNIYYLYFGLTIVGAASFLFRAFCPPIVKSHASPRHYVESEQEFLTDASINLLTEKTASAYLSEYNTPESPRKWLFHSRELHTQMDAVVQSMYISSDLVSGDTEGRFSSASDLPLTEKILEEVAVNRRASRSLVEIFRSEAKNRKQDFMVMEYFSDDITLGYLRISIYLFYLIGFLLLLIPTIRSLFKIVILAIGS